MTVNLITPAYLAGVADSDGSFSITKAQKTSTTTGYHYRGIFQLTWMISPESYRVMNGMKKRYGGSFSTCRRIGFNSDKKTVYKYSVEGAGLGVFLMEILPYLMLKKKQARTLLTFQTERKVHNKGYLKTKKQWDREAFHHLTMNGLNSKNKKV